MSDQPIDAGSTASKRNVIILMLLVFLAGAALRIFGTPVFRTGGFDEYLYKGYVDILHVYSLRVYPRLVALYTQEQLSNPQAELPPTRFLYIFCGYCWNEVFEGGKHSLDSLHAISCMFSVLMMPLAAVFAWRMGGANKALGVLVLTAVSPLQTYVSRHALIDGFFGFWAVLCLWLFWENLQRPGNGKWLAAYIVSIALTVLTKENAFFLYAAICGLIVVSPWLKLGVVSRALVLGTFAGALLGAAGIMVICGGLQPMIGVFHAFVTNVVQLDYAIITGDGPWHRYLGELLLVSPLVLLLAIGEVFQLTREKKTQLFMACFVGFSYAIMCNVRHGMNLRYTNMWDMPLRYLAVTQLGTICALFNKRKQLAMGLCLALICIVDLSQYELLFVENNIYEPVPKDLGHALKLFKNDKEVP